jgi:cytidylate kinase
MLVLPPIAGLATVAWRERGSVALEDARVFLRSRGRSRARRRLAEYRERLVAEFDAIASEWRAASSDRVDTAR